MRDFDTDPLSQECRLPSVEWQVESYINQSKNIWPGRGQNILAQYNENSVVVYQAFREEIAQYAEINKHFLGCPHYNPKRMTWVKTNFLWMMFRSKWTSKPNQEHIYAIWLHRDRFDYYLRCARKKGSARGETGTVRLQWDPDHFPDGICHPYLRAVQLGLRDIEPFANSRDIIDIVDITEFVRCQSKIALRKRQTARDLEDLMVASERVYTPVDVDAIDNLELSARDH